MTLGIERRAILPILSLMHRFPRLRLLFLLCFFCLVSSGQVPPPAEPQAEEDTTATAGDPTPAPETPPAAEAQPEESPATGLPSVERIREMLQGLPSGEGTDEAARTTIQNALSQAIALAEATELSLNRFSEFKARREAAPDRLNEVKAQIAKLQAQDSFTVPDTSTLAETEAALQEARTRLTEAESEYETLSRQASEWTERRRVIANRIPELRDSLDQLSQAQPNATPTANTPAFAEWIRRAYEIRSVRAQIDELTEEATSYEARRELRTLRIDLAALNRNRLRGLVSALDSRAQSQREAQVAEQRQAAEAAAVAAARSHPLIQAAADENKQLAEERSRIIESIQESDTEADQFRTRLDALLQTKEDIASRLRATGGSRALGLKLRREFEGLPRPGPLRERQKPIAGKIGETELRLEEVSDLRTALSDISVSVDQRIEESEVPIPPSSLERIKSNLSESLQNQRQILMNLQADLDRYFESLVSYDAVLSDYQEAVEDFRDYARQRILWIPNLPLFGSHIDDIRQSYDDWREADGASNLFSGVSSDLARQRGSTFILGVIAYVMAALLLWRQSIHSLRTLSSSPDFNYRLSISFEGLFWLVIRAGIIPAGLWLLSNYLYVTATTSALFAAGNGLRAAAVILFTLGLVRGLCRPGGIAEKHLRIESKRCALIRRALPPGITVVLAVLVCLAESFRSWDNETWQLVLARSFFILATLVELFLLAFVFRFRQGILALAKQPGVFASATVRGIAAIAAVGIPIMLIGLAVAGYFYAAYELSFRVLKTIWLIVVLVVANGLCIRWVRINKLRLLKAQKEKEAEEAAANGEPQSTDVVEQIRAEINEEEDIFRADIETRRLLRVVFLGALVVGIWSVWSATLPALREMASFALLGDPSDPSANPLTVGDATIALIVISITVYAVRDLPGLLDFMILRRIGMSPSASYAITQLLTYAIVMIGIVVGFKSLGIAWSDVQWLIAAVSVGLGFGLQEIVSNFVSGIILLVERPVRVGDVVTTGDTTGVVSRIRIRGTTVVNFDRQELIVPNKEFVTGRLINWSLTDKINRLRIAVGVKYGTDLAMAKKVLETTVRKHPNVIDDPAPAVHLTDFGDNSINFLIFAYLPNLDNRLQTQTDLIEQIDLAFKEAGIEIPFPQRDLHLRSVDENIVFRLPPGNLEA